MNESKDFVIKKLNNLFETIKGVKIKYEYRDYLSAHFIEVMPLETFEDNNTYLLAEMAIQDEFEQLFGGIEEILFISSDSLNKIKDVQFSLGYDIHQKFAIPLPAIHTFKLKGYDLNVIQEEENILYALAA